MTRAARTETNERVDTMTRNNNHPEPGRPRGIAAAPLAAVLAAALTVALGFGSANAPVARAQTAAGAANAPAAPAATFVTPQGRKVAISDYRGKPLMLWLVSTWCSSCSAGILSMEGKAKELEKLGLQVVVLRNYKNVGYPGPNIVDFVDQVMPKGATPPANWTLGEATKGLDTAYNRRHYPDVYFLIDRQGRVEAVDGAPSATMDRILAFAKKQQAARVGG